MPGKHHRLDEQQWPTVCGAGSLVCSFGFRHRAGVVVNDSPAFRKALKYERKNTADIALRAGQVPMAQNKGRIVAKKADFKSGEFQRAHRGAVRIIPSVAGANRVKSASNSAASGKG